MKNICLDKPDVGKNNQRDKRKQGSLFIKQPFNQKQKNNYRQKTENG